VLGPASLWQCPETLPGLMIGSMRPFWMIPQFMRQKALQSSTALMKHSARKARAMEAMSLCKMVTGTSLDKLRQASAWSQVPPAGLHVLCRKTSMWATKAGVRVRAGDRHARRLEALSMPKFQYTYRESGCIGNLSPRLEAPLAHWACPVNNAHTEASWDLICKRFMWAKRKCAPRHARNGQRNEG